MKQLEQIEEKRQGLLSSYPDRGEEVSQYREDVVSHLEKWQALAEETLAGKGTHVYHAQDAAEAKALIRQLAGDAHKLCRIDSPELAEIGFDQVMAELGKPVALTDLEEIIAREAGLTETNRHPQLRDLERLSQEDILACLQKYVGSEDVQDAQTLAKLTKQVIRGQIIASDFGVTGIDAIIAENGTIVLAENEGNGRMVSNLPYRHLVVAGLEKLYDTAEHAMKSLQAAQIYGLGRNNYAYYSFISGQSRTADIEFRMVYGMHGPLEVHLILLDNGRSKLIEKGCGNVLKCIDCGACSASLGRLAERNGWQGTLLTAKNVALLKARGELGTVEGLDTLEPFSCPAGVTAEDIKQALE